MSNLSKPKKAFTMNALADIPKNKRLFIIEAELPAYVDDLVYFNCGYSKKGFLSLGNAELSLKLKYKNM